MSIDRRKFIKFAGLTAAGIAAAPPLKLLGKDKPLLAEEGYEESGEASVEIQRAPHPPADVKRWAMVIDLKTCREHPDCSECTKACHLTHNVPDYSDSKDEVKWIWKEHFSHSFIESDHPYVTEHVKHSDAILLCNHCDNPPCVRVCPTQATWKREQDGIVMMDWHRCIGCRYCIAACPYSSRSFNYRDPRKYFEEKGIKPQSDFPTRTKGVVEKCTLCEERLARGQWPSCVLACPYNAMVVGDLDNPQDPVRRLLSERFTIRRKPGLGTQPEIYYIV